MCRYPNIVTGYLHLSIPNKRNPDTNSWMNHSCTQNPHSLNQLFLSHISLQLLRQAFPVVHPLGFHAKHLSTAYYPTGLDAFNFWQFQGQRFFLTAGDVKSVCQRPNEIPSMVYVVYVNMIIRLSSYKIFIIQILTKKYNFWHCPGLWIIHIEWVKQKFVRNILNKLKNVLNVCKILNALLCIKDNITLK